MPSPGVTTRWVQAQKATPSFTVEGANSNNPLDRPLPLSLAKYDMNVSGLVGPGSPSSPLQRANKTPTRRAASPAATTSASRGGASIFGASPRSTTPPAGGGRGAKPIHEDLIERGRMYFERKEALREKAIRREMSQCRAVPKINKTGAGGEEMARENIVSRLYKLEREKAKLNEYKLANLAKQDETRFNEVATFKPRISKKGHMAEGKTTLRGGEQWAARREQHLMDMRLQQIAVEMAAMQDAPEINPRSQQLANRRREAEGLAGLSPFEAMLERDRLAKLAQWEKQQLQAQLDNPGTPRITEMAARMHSDLSVVDRLQAHAELRDERLRIKREQAQEAELRGSGSGAEVPPHSPYFSGGASAQRGRGDADPYGGGGESGDVYARNLAFAKRRDENLQRIREEERRRHQPEIDPLSAAMSDRLSETTQDRLLRSRTPPPKSPPFAFASPATPMASATKPQQRPKSPSRASPADAAAYERLMAAERQRQRRLNETRDALLRQEMEAATFAPTLSRGTAERFAAAPDGGSSPPPNNGNSPTPSAAQSPAVQRIFERSMAWAQQRDQRLEEARQQRLEEESRGLTFEPDTSVAQARSQRDTGLYGGDGRAWGYDDYVNRMQAARGRGAGADDGGASPPPGDQQQPRRTTVPQEFHLGQDKPKVAALEPPVRAPLRTVAEGSMPIESRDAARRLADLLMGGGGNTTSRVPTTSASTLSLAGPMMTSHYGGANMGRNGSNMSSSNVNASHDLVHMAEDDD